MHLANGQVRKLRRSSEDPGCAHELTFSCYRRLPLLNYDRTRNWFVDALNAARQKHCLELWAYMPEHAHVLFVPLDPAYRIRGILQSIKQPVMRKAINYLRHHSPRWLCRLADQRTGDLHFWQPGGGYDRNVVSAETAWAIVEYIHNNPVKRRLVNDALAWPWSSARWYACQGEIALPMDCTPPTLMPRPA